MLARMLCNDLRRDRVPAAALFLFLLLCALLTAAGLSIAGRLGGAVDQLFDAARAPHFVQMHAGELDQSAVDAFTRDHSMISAQQTVELLNIGNSFLYLGSGQSEAGSIMENAFVVQNRDFDFLLDLNNQIIRLEPGQVAVPVYHMQQNKLAVGDTLRITGNGFDQEYTIAAFARDSQMNPSLVTSKRFVLHEQDWQALGTVFEEREYLIEFLLHHPGYAWEAERLYQAAGLPGTGTAITLPLLRTLNTLTDGLLAGVVVVAALLLLGIALLCLRFTILAALEDDLREIGVMKAIGLSGWSIGSLYMAKYRLLAGAGCLVGVLLAIPFGQRLAGNITLYMGAPPATPMQKLLPWAGAFVIFLLVMGFCRLVLRKLGKITAVQAMRQGARAGPVKPGLALSRRKGGRLNAFLGGRDVLSYPHRYLPLCLVFALCIFLMVLPLNLLTTVSSPEFLAYMGAGYSNIRIDLARTGSMEDEAARLAAFLEQDEETARYAALVTASYDVEASDGAYEPLKVENGDFAVFPLEYLEGRAPTQNNELALSCLVASSWAKAWATAWKLLLRARLLI